MKRDIQLTKMATGLNFLLIKQRLKAADQILVYLHQKTCFLMTQPINE